MSMPSSSELVATSAGQAAGLELLLDREALLAGDAAVVGADELLAGQLVEPLGEPLGEAAAVGEDDRAAVGADQLEDRAGGSPARCCVRASGFVAGPPGCSSSGRTSPSAVMSSTGTTTWSSSGLRAPASTIVTSRPGPTPPRNRAIVSSGRCVARQADPLRRRRPSPRRRDEALEALEAEGEVGAALRAGDRVDLVDDHVLDAAEDLAGLAREHQVERFGRRDEDVRRAAGDLRGGPPPACRRSGSRP